MTVMIYRFVDARIGKILSKRSEDFSDYQGQYLYKNPLQMYPSGSLLFAYSVCLIWKTYNSYLRAFLFLYVYDFE